MPYIRTPPTFLKDTSKFHEWEFRTNPQPTTFHRTTSTSKHVAHRSLPSPPIAKHDAHQHGLLKATTTMDTGGDNE